MWDAFAELKIDRSVEINKSRVEELYRAEAKSRHPDAGGDSADFEKISQAKAIVLDDVQRLRHLAELAGVESDEIGRGGVSSEIGDLFGLVADAVQKAKALETKLSVARSALQKALLQNEVITMQREISAIQLRLGEVSTVVLQQANKDSAAGLAQAARDLAFIGRWKGELQKAFAGLWV